MTCTDPAAIMRWEGKPHIPRIRRSFGRRLDDTLTWWPELGMGYYPVEEHRLVYDGSYFQKYEGYAETELGRQITEARIAFVGRHLPTAPVLDVGFGSGAFLEARRPSAPTFGFDVNHVGVAWLVQHELFRHPLAGEIEGMTFWDSLEHIQDPVPILANATWVFVTLPIFQGPDHVLQSKHFRRDEHFWYFTRAGLIGWMMRLGFACREHSLMEAELGREDVESFAFERVR